MRTRSSVVKSRARATRAPDPPVAPLDSRLLSDERLGILFILWLVGRATVASIDRRIARTGLSADEFPVYCLLDLAGPLTPTALGTWMAAPATTVSAFVKRLEARGHVARRPNPADGRSCLLELTDAGRTAQNDAIRRFAPLADRVQRALGHEAGAIRLDLLHLRDVIDAAREAEANEAPA